MAKDPLFTLGQQYYTYFMWKNGLMTRYTNYGAMTKEEVISKYFKGDKDKFERMKSWERTEKYLMLKYRVLRDRQYSDFLEIYQTVCENAKKGDEKAIRTFLSLQKELENNLRELEGGHTKDKDKDDDGLTLSV